MSYPARRRRAGQGARPADRAGPGDPRRAPPDGRGDARPRPTSCARRRPSRSRARPAAWRSCKAARPSWQALEKADRRRRWPSRRPQYGSWPENKAKLRKALVGHGARPPEAARSARSTSSSPRRSTSGNIPSRYNGTLRWPMAGHGHPGLRLHRLRRGSRRSGGCAHFHSGIDIVAAVRDAGPGRPAPARSSTSAGTTPTAPTRPGS